MLNCLIMRGMLPVHTRQYSNPRREILEYLHVGTAVLARTDYPSTKPNKAKAHSIPVL